jgi:hypothetical protein
MLYNSIIMPAIFISSVDFHPKTEPPKQRGFTLYTFASRLQKQDARFNPYMLYASLLATSPSEICDRPHIHNLLNFISLLCCPLLPATKPQSTNHKLVFLKSPYLQQEPAESKVTKPTKKQKL